MSNEDQSSETLRELQLVGLTKEEAKAYIPLVQNVELTAAKLCKMTGIPSSRIYYILESLERLGLIFVQDGSPKLYKSLHPYEAFDNLRTLTIAQYEKKLRVLDNLTFYFASSSPEADFEYLLKKRTHELQERMKELKCLYQVSKILDTKQTLKNVLPRVITIIPQAWQYPSITAARIIIEEEASQPKEFFTKNFRQTRWSLTSLIRVNEKEKGRIEIFYLEGRPEMPSGEGPFLAEERELIDAIAIEIGKYLERLSTIKTLEKNAKDLEERMNTLSFLHTISAKLMGTEENLDSILSEIVDHLHTIWNVPEITSAQIVLNDINQTYETSNFQATPWNYEVQIGNEDEPIGSISIYYHTEPSEAKGTSKLTDERAIITTLSKLIAGKFKMDRGAS